MSDQNEPKKETVRITLPPPPSAKPAAKMEERDTVRINLPARPPSNGMLPEAPRRAMPPVPPPSTRPAPPPPMSRPPIPLPSTGAIRPPALAKSPIPVPPSAGTANRPTPPPPPSFVRPAAPTPAAPPPPAPASAAAPAPIPVAPPRPRVLPPPRAVSAAPLNYPGSGAPTGPKKETARISILPEPAAPPAPAVKMTKTQPLMAAPQPKVHTAAVKVAATAPQTSEKISPTALFEMLDTIPMPVCWIIFGISSITLLIQIWNYLSS